ncbi:MAG TPA: zeta toxin family protein [Bryobacteraceae bacterium]
MIIVAGPPGGGKSTHLAVKNWGVDWFNSDDRAAQLNAGSYQNIPTQVRAASGQQLQQFIESHIESRRSLVFENALRTDTCFQQIRRAKERGFHVRFNYLAAGPVEEHIRRVINRAALGGHSASARRLREIYQLSMKHLLTAFEENQNQHIDLLRIYDNAEIFGRPRVVLSRFRGARRIMASEIPAWLETALAGSTFSIPNLRAAMRSKPAE